jgi:hypothetical protein
MGLTWKNNLLNAEDDSVASFCKASTHANLGTDQCTPRSLFLSDSPSSRTCAIPSMCVLLNT